MITVRAVTSTTDFDYDRLYADSYEAMASGTYIWPDGMTDEAERKTYFANWINGVMVDPVNFKGFVVCINDIDMIYFTAWMQGNVAWLQCALVAYDDNGSKAYHAGEQFINTWKTYLSGLGAAQIGVLMLRNSPTRQVVMSVYNIPESAMEFHGYDCERGLIPNEE